MNEAGGGWKKGEALACDREARLPQNWNPYAS